ncbi:uncharacterized protein LOC110863097 isoform X2 [Folsomia candida]|uniref:uncharacterized protein LOC110863097 isoform X2 n=1 Tax=Folsomia candida TaxID=158441 RepID=UPI000B8F725B|nr:uncharacterized protein LOC110863097 isoform X2 [Folsomia candida]
MSRVLVVLWGAVVAGAVLGRILDEPAGTTGGGSTEGEVYSSHPDIERAQLEAWGSEFFQPPFSSHRHTPSRTELLQRFPRRQRTFVTSASSPAYNNNERASSNTRHYEVESVDTGSLDAVVKPENLEWMLTNIFSYPRNHNTNETAKEGAKKYILDSFQVTSGLQTALQHFKPLQFLSIYDGYSLPQGANIIGILEGSEWGTANDRPTLVGAHWDTVAFTPGTDDNGSGTAAMLEAARAISHSGCTPKYSLIFVAFDLEEVGSQGSLLFIKDFLSQILKTDSPHDVPLERFQGAFIMDTIMNMNETEGSQTFPRDWSLLLPDVYDVVADAGYRGDFLSMIYRKSVDGGLAERFVKHWDQRNSLGPSFRLQPFPLALGKELPEMQTLADHLNFLRSDHSRFWYMNDTAMPTSLKAVLMTDTGPYRGNMRNCYHTVCDGPEVSVLNNPTNLKFLAKITQVLTDTLIDMSQCDIKSSSSSTTNLHHNFVKTNNVHAKSATSQRTSESPLRNLLNFVRWMEFS